MKGKEIMSAKGPLATANFDGYWLDDPVHRAWLWADGCRQLDFFRASLDGDGGFDVLDWEGAPIPDVARELHTTTRLVHSYALGKSAGVPECDAIIDAGMDFLWNKYRDGDYGGYVWSVSAEGNADETKLAYGHVFVLLAAASAKQVGHPDADRLIADVFEVIDQHYWDEDRGLLRDEFRRDWTAFSNYRGMNANMHGVEALLAAFEATGEQVYLERAGRILGFFVGRIAPAYGWRLPEHYTDDWQVDPNYHGNPMFRPAGSTPGHSLELGRLVLQHWDLCGRPDSDAFGQARKLIDRALADAWTEQGGLVYTLDLQGCVAIADRYWWPVAEAIGAMATLLKLDPCMADEGWYRRLWAFADTRLIDHARGGWYPELDSAGAPTSHQFHGKPDIYHSLQAALFPLAPSISRLMRSLGSRQNHSPHPSKDSLGHLQ